MTLPTCDILTTNVQYFHVDGSEYLVCDEAWSSDDLRRFECVCLTCSQFVSAPVVDAMADMSVLLEANLVFILNIPLFFQITARFIWNRVHYQPCGQDDNFLFELAIHLCDQFY